MFLTASNRVRASYACRDSSRNVATGTGSPGRARDDAARLVLACDTRALLHQYGRERPGENETLLGKRYGDDLCDEQTRALQIGQVPALRWSTPGLSRLGKRHESVIRAMLDAGGEMTMGELMRRFGSERQRRRDFQRRILEPMVEGFGILELAGRTDGATVRLRDGWRGELENARELGDEIAAARRQRDRHARERAAFQAAARTASRTASRPATTGPAATVATPPDAGA